ncbi:MAG: proton-conducting transporter membrane subunit [Vicinamibacterales bacterium]
MTPLTSPASAPWETLAVCLLLFAAPTVAVLHRPAWWLLGGMAGALAAALAVNDGPTAYAIAAGGALLHAVHAWRWSRTGAATLAVAGAATGASAAALATGQDVLAFALSTFAIALRAGVPPLHGGVASLCERAPAVQTQQMSSVIALVFLHLRYVDHVPAVAAWAPWLVNYGALMCLLAALMTVVQRDLRGFYRGTTTMHGGMLLAALGAAVVGNFAAALLVAVTIGLALGGLGMMTTALEERVGPARYAAPGGRAGAFPVLAAAFAVFGGAGVGLPGTAGFVADDLLLHTLWQQSPPATAAVIVSSALVAVATLIAYSRVFLGTPVSSVAPDLALRERAVAVLLFALLVGLGVLPEALLQPADVFLSAVPPLA